MLVPVSAFQHIPTHSLDKAFLMEQIISGACFTYVIHSEANTQNGTEKILFFQ
ncbi:hypothetical protein SAMN05216311_105278 [Chitinophaga sp. CF418]|nr:hypothetical protein SAMN05216311_105278 [Chitinophaga sp. CF418]